MATNQQSEEQENLTALRAWKPVACAVQGGFLKSFLCQGSVDFLHEGKILSYISGLLKSGSVSPEEIATKEKAEEEQKEKVARELELCAMDRRASRAFFWARCAARRTSRCDTGMALISSC